jgi:hypothetical protein
MPKTKISEYSATNSSNTDIEGINIDEGCAPSGINNAIRELMVHLKEFQTGASGDAFTFAGGTLMSGTNTISGAAIISGNINSSGTNTFSGSNVMSFSGGSSASPSIYFASDTNTGIFSPAADTIAFTEGGVESMRINSSGNVGVGTTSPTGYRLNAVAAFASGVGGAYIEAGEFNQPVMVLNHTNGSVSANLFQVQKSGTGVLTLDSSGRLILGDTTADGRLKVVETAAGAGVTFYNSANNSAGQIGTTNESGTVNGLEINAYRGDGKIVFKTAGIERARITSGGAIWAGNTTRQGTDNHTFIASVTTGDWTTNFQNNAASGAPLGILVNYSSIAPNNTGSFFITANDSAATRFELRSNGGIANYSANDVNLSDRREKTNFAPATSYLDKICAIPVQTFNYIDQNMEDDGGLTLGVVAQDVQAVAPELVMESNWASKDDEPKMRLSIYQTDLQYALMKCIQELKAELDAANTRLAALENK